MFYNPTWMLAIDICPKHICYDCHCGTCLMPLIVISQHLLMVITATDELVISLAVIYVKLIHATFVLLLHTDNSIH